MNPSALFWFLRRGAATLKFKIVAIAVVTGLAAALGAVHLALETTEHELERVLLAREAQDAERTAALLGDKLEMLVSTLKAVTRRAPPNAWADAAAMTAYLRDKPAIEALFDSVAATDAQGAMLVRMERGEPKGTLASLADREYFKRAQQTDQPVISKPLVGQISKLPLVVLAMPAIGADGRHVGLLLGTLGLRSTGLFTVLSSDKRPEVNELVIDRSGVLLSHPNPQHMLSSALAERGVRGTVQRWLDSGAPIDTQGAAQLSDGALVATSGIPGSDWLLVRVTDEADALRPINTARRRALQHALGVALVSGLLAGAAGWAATRPITRLRRRAEQLLVDADAHGQWPSERGEIGRLATVFEQVVAQRSEQQAEVQGLLVQLHSVLDNAQVGIAFTRSGHFELVSAEFCHIFRCSKQDAIGQRTRTIYPNDATFEALIAEAGPALSRRGAFDGEVEMIRRNGELFWGHLRGRAVVAGDVAAGTIWIIEDVTDVRSRRERLTWTAAHDALTGLANRAAFEVALEEATRSAATSPFSALFIDLDRFKPVNDTAGHAAGDALLRGIALELQKPVRRSDLVARLGGDEFAVLLPQCALPQAAEIAEKMRLAVMRYELPWDGHVFSVGASIGVVAVDGAMSSAAEVLHAADKACYAAKHAGRNQVAVNARHAEPRTLETAAI